MSDSGSSGARPEETTVIPACAGMTVEVFVRKMAGAEPDTGVT
jgi:hypothetical protein